MKEVKGQRQSDLNRKFRQTKEGPVRSASVPVQPVHELGARPLLVDGLLLVSQNRRRVCRHVQTIQLNLDFLFFWKIQWRKSCEEQGPWTETRRGHRNTEVRRLTGWTGQRQKDGQMGKTNETEERRKYQVGQTACRSNRQRDRQVEEPNRLLDFRRPEDGQSRWTHRETFEPRRTNSWCPWQRSKSKNAPARGHVHGRTRLQDFPVWWFGDFFFYKWFFRRIKKRKRGGRGGGW